LDKIDKENVKKAIEEKQEIKWEIYSREIHIGNLEELDRLFNQYIETYPFMLETINRNIMGQKKQLTEEIIKYIERMEELDTIIYGD
jgi:hypothetical protein